MSDYHSKDGIILLILFMFTIFYLGIFIKDLQNTYMYYLIFIAPFIIYFIYKYCYILIDKLIHYLSDSKTDSKTDNNIEIQHDNL
tara:strand:- start:109 stop:363 length:255 start_codon:yes stop_codon:yes gene_type:complete